MNKKLHFQKFKLDFNEKNSATVNYQDLIDTAQINLRSENPTMDVIEAKELRTVTDNYFIATFRIKEKRSRIG